MMFMGLGLGGLAYYYWFYKKPSSHVGSLKSDIKDMINKKM